MTVTILQGDCREVLKTLPDCSVNTCVTSPPYYGLRDYKTANWTGGDANCDHIQRIAAHGGERADRDQTANIFYYKDKCGKCGATREDDQIGLEETPADYVEKLVGLFREVRRVLRDDGTLWLNLGDSYNNFRTSSGPAQSVHKGKLNGKPEPESKKRGWDGLKEKDLIGIPWRVALALQADGWYLRQDIVWCLSGGVWVYAKTQKGEMPVMVKDLVRLDPRNVKLWNGNKWTQVLGWGASNDTSERLELVLRSGERIGCTGQHLWPTHRGDVAARELRVGDTISMCNLPEPEECKYPPFLTDRLLWLIGLYLAEGSKADDTLQLTLNADEIVWLPDITAAASDLGASVTHTVKDNTLHVRMYGRILHAVIDEYIGGKRALDKHLRNSVWKLPNTALKQIANGYLSGDAHKEGKRFRLGFCRNYSLERDLRILAARLGATITLRPSTVDYAGKKQPTFRGEWRWTRSGHKNEKNRGEIIEIRNSRARKFWDISVADEPHLFALASGVLTHNCKENPMPESVKDRCTKAHEYIFLMSKNPRYYFDSEAIKEPVKTNTKTSTGEYYENRNKRSVWNVPTRPYKEAHFATFPPDLIEPCILAGCPKDGMVLDPFGGSGTTGMVSELLGRSATLIELNPEYIKIAENRIERANPKLDSNLFLFP